MLLTSCLLQLRRIRSRKGSREPTEDFPAGDACDLRESDDRRLAIARKHAAFVAARCHALDRQRRSPVAGVARHCRRADCPARPVAENCQGSPESRVSACVAAGHGRFKSVPGSFAHDLRKNHSFPYPARARFDRSRAGKRVRASDGYSKNALHCFEQVGRTLEPKIFKQYFFERTKQAVGAVKVGSHFMAITDPGSKMQQVAEADRFLHIFFGRPSIGGRYSALSNFGMVPAAVMGLDTKKFLTRTAEMVRACGAGVAVEENPGAVLGIILGTAAKAGRDKVTIIASPGVRVLGAWLEELLAESTGKN